MRAILFDWDGTIVDSIERLYDAYAVVARHYGLPFDRDVYHRVFAPDWRLIYRRLGLPEHQIDEAGHVWVEAFASASVEPFSGIAGRLAALRRAGHPLGVVTGGYREVVEPQLERTGIGELLDVRVFGDETADRKPDPAPLRLAVTRLAERFGAALAGDEPAIYVGDAPDDMRMAAAAGFRGIGIVSVIADAGTLLDAGASEAVESTVGWIDSLLAPRPARAADRPR